MSALITKYIETQNIDETIEYHKSCVQPIWHQMAQLLNQLEMIGIDYEELENGMPMEQVELVMPDFDSFVAFDIETTGTYGASNGEFSASFGLSSS